jgi:spore coat polysaccharide biosynthesis protein SpsF
MRTGVFVQVRMGSTRLPGKALLPLQGISLIRHAMRALNAVPADVHALLMDEASAPALAGEAEAESFEVFVGPELDVLARYCRAMRQYSVQRVIRATGDNPLVSAVLARMIIGVHEEIRAHLSHFLGCPWGTGVEVVEAESLSIAERESSDPAEHEHITTFLYRRPERFTIVEPQAPESMNAPEARVSIDTEQDYRLVTRIFADLYRGAPIEADDVVSWFRRRSGAHGG